ncbi:MAG TPA: cytochrome P450 [Polyangiales bacterium]|nr:cytochrome P450 [Polyangiales bacterium]
MNDDLDLLSPQHVANPFPLYRELRENAPVYWSERLQGWLLTRADDVGQWLEDGRFSANRTHLFAKHQLRGMDPAVMKDYLRLTSSMIVMQDGAQHDRLRKQEDRALCPAHVDHWSPALRRIMNELLDRVQVQRSMEFVADVAEPLPSLLLTDIFGIPAEDRHDFQRWADDATAFFAVTPANVEAVAARANAGMVALERYITALIATRREHPGRDPISSFIEAERSGAISTQELVANCVHMLIVGHVTSIAQLSNGIYELLRHPQALSLLRRNPELMANAVEETVRFSPAVHFTHRIATEDVRIRDKTIEKGQIAFFGIASAARDPSLVPNPDEFDITRANGRPIAFGAGPHSCAGLHLGRRELAVGYELLLERMPELRVDETEVPLRRANGLTFRGFARLALRF